MSLNYLRRASYDAALLAELTSAPLVHASEARTGTNMPVGATSVRVEYRDNREYEMVSRQLGIMDNIKANVPRAACKWRSARHDSTHPKLFFGSYSPSPSPIASLPSSRPWRRDSQHQRSPGSRYIAFRTDRAVREHLMKWPKVRASSGPGARQVLGRRGALVYSEQLGVWFPRSTG